MEWQAVVGLEDGELLVERPSAKPNPAVEVEQISAGWHTIQGGLVTLEKERRRQAGDRTLLRRVVPMRISGQRVKRTRLVQTSQYVVAVEVELVIPDDDPSEPCYEAETVNLLREIQMRAEQGDLEWLKQRGKVYAAIEAA